MSKLKSKMKVKKGLAGAKLTAAAKKHLLVKKVVAEAEKALAKKACVCGVCFWLCQRVVFVGGAWVNCVFSSFPRFRPEAEKRPNPRQPAWSTQRVRRNSVGRWIFGLLLRVPMFPAAEENTKKSKLTLSYRSKRCSGQCQGASLSHQFFRWPASASRKAKKHQSQ